MNMSSSSPFNPHSRYPQSAPVASTASPTAAFVDANDVSNLIASAFVSLKSGNVQPIRDVCNRIGAIGSFRIPVNSNVDDRVLAAFSRQLRIIMEGFLPICHSIVPQLHDHLRNILIYGLFSFRRHCELESSVPSNALTSVTLPALYRRLLLTLLSSNGNHLSVVIDALIQTFLPEEQQGNAINSDGSVKEVPEPGSTAEQLFFTELHTTIRDLCALVPTSASLIISTIKAKYPHKRLSVIHQRCYLRHLLCVMGYVPSVRAAMMTVIVDKLVEIDVEIKLDLEDGDQPTVDKQTATNCDDDNDDDMFEIEGVNQTSMTSLSKESPPLSAASKENSVMSEKMDVMMDMCFEYLTVRCCELNHDNNKRDHNQCISSVDDGTLRSLIAAWEMIVLPTHQTKFTQFLIFYATSLHSAYTTFVLQHLHGLFQSPTLSSQHQVNVMLTLSGLLSRGKFIPIHVVYSYLRMFIEWCLNYVSTSGHEQPTADIDIHLVFYATIQSILYILCYKIKQIVQAGNYLNIINGVLTCLHSSLHPLIIISSTVSREFIRICSILLSYSSPSASIHSLSTVLDLYNNNNRLSVATRTDGGRINTLDYYFPFDPYLLRSSSRFITEEIYVEWSDPLGDDVSTNTKNNVKKHDIGLSRRDSEDSRQHSVVGSVSRMSFSMEGGDSSFSLSQPSSSYDRSCMTSVPQHIGPTSANPAFSPSLNHVNASVTSSGPEQFITNSYQHRSEGNSVTDDPLSSILIFTPEMDDLRFHHSLWSAKRTGNVPGGIHSNSPLKKNTNTK